MSQLASRVVVVTGGTSSLGRAAVSKCLQEGARVAIVDTDSTQGAQMAKELGANVRFIAARQDAPESFGQAVVRAAQEMGQIYGLVNVVQDPSTTQPFIGKTDADFAGVFASVRGIAQAMRAAFPSLKQSHGRVVNVGSVYGATSYAYLSSSVTADYALQGLTRSVGVEWAQDGVLVNYLSPGALDVPELRAFRERHPQVVDKLVHGLALQRLGNPVEDFGGALMFLLSDEACFLVGHPVHADGGQHLVAPVFEPGAQWAAS